MIQVNEHAFNGGKCSSESEIFLKVMGGNDSVYFGEACKVLSCLESNILPCLARISPPPFGVDDIFY